MSRRRRWGFILGFAFVLAVIAVVLFSGGNGRPRVELFFLGYTNQVVFSVGPGGIVAPSKSTGPFAVFLATNSGSSRVRLNSIWPTRIFGDVTAYTAWPSNMFSTVLKPRETSLVFSYFNKDGVPFYARLGYQTYGRRDGLAYRFMSNTNAMLLKLGRWLDPKREVIAARSEMVTAPLGAGMDLDEVLRLPPRPPQRPIVPGSP